jgi:hypothetical protein
MPATVVVRASLTMKRHNGKTNRITLESIRKALNSKSFNRGKGAYTITNQIMLYSLGQPENQLERAILQFRMQQKEGGGTLLQSKLCRSSIRVLWQLKLQHTHILIFSSIRPGI